MRDFSDLFKKPKTTNPIRTTTREFVKGLPPTKKTRIAKDLRRAMAWDYFCQGWEVPDIAREMDLANQTIRTYLKQSRDIVRPLMQQDAIDDLAQFASEQKIIMKKAFQRIAKIENIEDMWIERVFGKKDEEEEDPFWNTAPKDGEIKKRRPQQTQSEIPLKQESVAALLDTAAKASMNVAKAKGLITNKVDVNVQIDRMGDQALIIALREGGIDPSILGIEMGDTVEGEFEESDDPIEEEYEEEEYEEEVEE